MPKNKRKKISKQEQQKIRRDNIALFQSVLKFFRDNSQHFLTPVSFYPSPPQWKGHGKLAKISVVNMNCITAAIMLKRKCYSKIAMHNMACYSNPGGGVTRGANAQEEFLCRISNLYPSLLEAKKNGMYPLKKGFITTNVSFCRDEKYDELTVPFMCDVLTISSPRFDRNITVDTINTRQKAWINKRMLELIELGIGYDAVVLSAPGCGAFNNPPEFVASCLKYWLIDKKYAYYFKEIVFAIIDDHNSDGNFAKFKKVLDPESEDDSESDSSSQSDSEDDDNNNYKKRSK